MAYSAAVYLRQLLEQEFIQFFCRSLEFEETKIRGFHSRLGEVLDKLKTPTSPSSLSEEVLDYFNDLNPKTLGVDPRDDYTSVLGKVRLNDQSILIRIPELMDLLDEVNSMLHNFLEYHDLLCGLSCHTLEILAVQSSWKFVNHLISITHEFQEVVSLLNAMAEEAIYLHDILGVIYCRLSLLLQFSAILYLRIYYELGCDGGA